MMTWRHLYKHIKFKLKRNRYHIPGLVCQLRPPINIFLEWEKRKKFLFNFHVYKEHISKSHQQIKLTQIVLIFLFLSFKENFCHFVFFLVLLMFLCLIWVLFSTNFCIRNCFLKYFFLLPLSIVFFKRKIFKRISYTSNFPISEKTGIRRYMSTMFLLFKKGGKIVNETKKKLYQHVRRRRRQQQTNYSEKKSFAHS
jgi:hypothetical protein